MYSFVVRMGVGMPAYFPLWAGTDVLIINTRSGYVSM